VSTLAAITNGVKQKMNTFLESYMKFHSLPEEKSSMKEADVSVLPLSCTNDTEESYEAYPAYETV